MTKENDIVLIYYENNPMVFARIEDVTADHKKGWYLVKLLILGIPLQTVHWLLRDAYIDGAEFTMDGKKMRLEKVVCPPDKPGEDLPGTDSRTDDAEDQTDRKASVIPFPTQPES
jgi:hypothetical protein